MSDRRERLEAAIDALAALYEGGHLLASTEPDRLLRLAVQEIRGARTAVARQQILSPHPEDCE